MDFGNARLSGANFTGADFRGSEFRDAVVESANFSAANIDGLSVTNSLFMGSVFTHEGLRNHRRSFDWDEKKLSGLVFKKRPKFNNTWLDGVILDYPLFVKDFLIIEKSSLRNAEINIRTTLTGNQIQEKCGGLANDSRGLFECIEENSPREDIADSDLTCAMIYEDNGINLSGSNISSARFPNRYIPGENNFFVDLSEFETERNEEIKDGAKFVSSTSFGFIRWSPESQTEFPLIYDLPWAWADMQPLANLSGERIISCDNVHRKSDFIRRSPAAEFPKECIEEKEEDGKIQRHMLLFKFPEPKPIDEFDAQRDALRTAELEKSERRN